MKTLAIKRTVQPDFKVQSHSAWRLAIKNRNNQKNTLLIQK
jgi:hypothetical protein